MLKCRHNLCVHFKTHLYLLYAPYGCCTQGNVRVRRAASAGDELIGCAWWLTPVLCLLDISVRVDRASGSRGLVACFWCACLHASAQAQQSTIISTPLWRLLKVDSCISFTLVHNYYLFYSELECESRIGGGKRNIVCCLLCVRTSLPKRHRMHKADKKLPCFWN